jgi:hypothetical protein
MRIPSLEMWVVLKDLDVLKQLFFGDSWKAQYNSYILFCLNFLVSRGEIRNSIKLFGTYGLTSVTLRAFQNLGGFYSIRINVPKQ